MNVGSLCSGIGGLEFGVERALGATTMWQSEIDPHASTVLARHWPDVPNLGDLNTIDWTQVEPVDLLCAGYPCQPFSHAGRRKGDNDPRHLWPGVLRAIRGLRPRFVLLENVSGHLSLGFDDVLGDLAETGYDTQWTCLRSSDVGAPHRRERVFIVAHPAGTGRQGSTRRWLHHQDADLAVTDTRRAGTRRDSRSTFGTEEPVGWSEPGHPDTPVAGAAIAPDTERLGRGERSGSGSGQTSRQWRHGSDDDGRAATPDPAPRDWGQYRPAITRWEAIHGPAPAPTDTRRRLNPGFVEWMMGFPAGWTDGLSRTAALRCLGNSVQPQVGELAALLLLDPLLNRDERRAKQRFLFGITDVPLGEISQVVGESGDEFGATAARVENDSDPVFVPSAGSGFGFPGVGHVSDYDSRLHDVKGIV